MSPYRDVPRPAETNQYIELPNRQPGYRIYGYLQVAPLMLTHGVVAYAMVAPFRFGAAWWWLPLGVLIWPLLPVLVTRCLMRNTQLIGTQGLVVRGVFQDRKLRWSGVLGVEATTQPGPWGDTLSLTVETHRGDFRMADFKTRDPNRTLEWALHAAAEGRLMDIAERVAREGTPSGRWRHAWVGLCFSLLATAAAVRHLLLSGAW